MATAPVISVSEYLRSAYHPDVEYIDGRLRERNVGLQPHSALQAIIGHIFSKRRRDWDIRVLIGQRVQVTETRFRIPDICALRRADPKDRIVSWAPLLCIEVLSEEDRLNDLQTKVDEFVGLGVEHIWVIDPWKRIAYYASSNGFERPADGRLRITGTPIEILLADVFAELDED
ncbi:MAG TPA: Uma2 family endonuclease [Acidobacteriaceae bacterium]